jgi:two-component sensor histidine kinase
MAALHRRLSAHRAPGEDLQRHCLALCTDTVLSFGRGDIALSIEAIDAPITRRCEQRLALLLVELTTNAIKHGRAPDSGGEISIRLHLTPGEELELVFEDNFGPPPFDVAPEPAFVTALVAEMGGALDIGCRPVYRTQVRFPAQ